MYAPPKKRTFDSSSDESTPLKKRYRTVVEEKPESPQLSEDEDFSSSSAATSSAPSNKTGQNKAWDMLEKMGHKKGKGLGLHEQGRAEPIEVQMRRPLRGLGAEPKGLEPSYDVTWDTGKEQITVEETAVWLPKCTMSAPTAEEMKNWIRTDKKLLAIDNETQFCDASYLTAMLAAKNVFNELNDRELRNARTRANPFETIRGAIFQNRAAMKMANMDAVFDDLFTDPKTADGTLWIPKDADKLFYFADVCAGPGGFTEYVLWRRGWSAHGFGFTLRGKDDFKLDNFLAAHAELFEPHYGKGGLGGDGNIMDPENLATFRAFVRDHSEGVGVHLVMADGGFSVEGQENIQEILSKRLYLCQTLCALNILRPGGNFVCKLFDVFTPFSVGLLYLLWRCFDEVCLHKPHTSRPANSERYVICKGLREDSESVRQHFENANLVYDRLHKEGRSKEEDIIDLVPLETLLGEEEFFHYVKESNERLAERQTLYLDKYRAYARNANLQDFRQEDLRLKCLNYWRVPDDKRPQQPRPDPNDRLQLLCQDDVQWVMNPVDVFDAELIRKENDRCRLRRFHVFPRTSNPGIFIAVGKTKVYMYEDKRWIEQHNLNIPRDTILFAELSEECHDDQADKKYKKVLLVFDAYSLGGDVIIEKSFAERRRLIKKFCLATKKSLEDKVCAQLSDEWNLLDIPALRNRFCVGQVKNGGQRPTYYCPKNDDRRVRRAVNGFIIYDVLNPDWICVFSKTQQHMYYFNTKTNKSCYSQDAEKEGAFCGFKASYAKKKSWPPIRKDRQDVQQQLAALLELADLVEEKKNPTASDSS